MDLIERAAQRIQQRNAQSPAPGPTAPPPLAQSGPAPLEQPALVEPAAAAAGENGTPPNGNFLNIDFARVAASGILTPERARDQMIEEFRHIKRHVLSGMLDQNMPNRNVVMVTSALPGEGKTHVSINLAISLALEHDWSSLLIDGDVITPQIHRRLGLPSETGLMDALSDPTVKVEDIIYRTNIEKLSMIGAGSGHASSTELLSSQRMSSLIDAISNQFPDRIIVIDTPPLLATTEPAVMARHAGQIFVVVEAEKTRHSTIEAALGLLDQGQKVRLVLNKVRPQFGDSAFGPYYAYFGYYGYGSARTRKDDNGRAGSGAATNGKLRMPWRRADKF